VKFAGLTRPKTRLRQLQEENARLRLRVQQLESQLSAVGWAAQNASEERERQSFGDWDRMGKVRRRDA
jgi:regulator of replication initiation timing